jgi:choline dehydrogenase-like flavoprotein
MDHCNSLIGRFQIKDWHAILKRFGFLSIRHRGRAHLIMPGLVLSKEVQERERLMHCAGYVIEERAPDDPMDALKRLLCGRSDRPISDILAFASSPSLIAKHLGIRMFESHVLPHRLEHVVINAIITRFPNFAVREFRSRSLMHKLSSVVIEGISEQCPDPESRITLSEKCDSLGMPLARVNWRIGDEARRSLMRLGQLFATELPQAALPKPLLEDWVVKGAPKDSVIIDMGHTAGTTRMSDNPKLGVVNSNCQVHGVSGLYVVGASVFPTVGHANPTLMILSLAIRLADRIKVDLAC